MARATQRRTDTCLSSFYFAPSDLQRHYRTISVLEIIFGHASIYFQPALGPDAPPDQRRRQRGASIIGSNQASSTEYTPGLA